MKTTIILFTATVALTSFINSHAHAWGQNGHRIIGELAQKNLTQAAQDNINQLTLGESLAQMSTWADEIRSNPNWHHASPWHYVSIEDDETWKTLDRNPKGDIIEGLKRFEKVLIDPKASQLEKWQALAFYVHFVGDIHQPLHVGYNHDHGGNKIKLKWFGEETNLHSVWDTKLIEHQKLSYTEFTDFISRISDENMKNWVGKSYYDWADESKSLRAAAYNLEKNRDGQPDLCWQYVYDHTPTIKLRLQQAGIRLADKLNTLFAK
ncbi:S1/P1 nuclease [Shewanella maritima]|uniref:S1/P1 nuclease n=1 Tax=Shewanella maritima TaxID=2520507 RepID=UPI003736DFED